MTNLFPLLDPLAQEHVAQHQAAHHGLGLGKLGNGRVATEARQVVCSDGITTATLCANLTS